jgi:glucokinase
MKVRLGIDLGGTFIKAGIIGKSHQVLYKFKIDSGAKLGRRYVIGNLKEAYKILTDICSHKKYTALSLGIGSPGTITQPIGKVVESSPNIKNWHGVVISKIFKDIKIPIYVENDANSVAVAEYLISNKCRYKDMIFVTVGTGIGGGIIIDGRLHRGSNYQAAEIGHSIIKHNGKLCGCGKRGCLETYASVPNMMKRFRHWALKFDYKGKKNITPIELYKLFKKQNRAAVKTIEENTDYLGVGLGSLINVLNPQAVVIGGGFADSGREYIDILKKSIKTYAIRSAFSKLKILKAKLGNDAGFVGASLLSLVSKDGRINEK